MTWGECVGAAGYPVGCQIGRLTRHETPLRLARPSQATKISKPNRFAYPFRSRPRGVCGSCAMRAARRPTRATATSTSMAKRAFPLTPEDATAESVSRFWRRLAASCRAARAAWDTIFRFTCCLLRVPRSSRAAPHFLLVPSAGPSDLLLGKYLRSRRYRRYLRRYLRYQ